LRRFARAVKGIFGQSPPGHPEFDSIVSQGRGSLAEFRRRRADV
jgi:hypothetical protein